MRHTRNNGHAMTLYKGATYFKYHRTPNNKFSVISAIELVAFLDSPKPLVAARCQGGKPGGQHIILLMTTLDACLNQY